MQYIYFTIMILAALGIWFHPEKALETKEEVKVEKPKVIPDPRIDQLMAEFTLLQQHCDQSGLLGKLEAQDKRIEALGLVLAHQKDRPVKVELQMPEVMKTEIVKPVEIVPVKGKPLKTITRLYNPPLKAPGKLDKIKKQIEGLSK